MSTYNLNIDTVNTSLDFYQAEKHIFGSSRLGMLKDSVNVLGSAYGNTDTSNFVHTLGNKRYELSNHLGNVLTVISDKPIPHNNGGTVDYFMADIKSAQDYSPFGVTLSGRDFNSSESRYGYQGSEKDDEVKGRGNSYTTQFRQLDPRLGRWLTIDPVVQPWQSPYNSMNNNPIRYSDVLGNTVDPTSSGYDEAKKAATPTFKKDGKTIDLNKSIKNGYEPEFAKIFNDFDNNTDILVKFEKITDKQYGGSISTSGKNENGITEYSVLYDPSLTADLGASALFEESFHLKEAIEGKEMAFIADNSADGYGVDGVDLLDEVRAKKWVATNIKSFKKTQTKSDELIYFTHYGYISSLTNDKLIVDALRSDNINLTPKSLDVQSGGRLGGKSIFYKPMGFGGKYKTFPTEAQYPAK